jgi:hypothetical protein
MQRIDLDGVIDLGEAGVAVIAEASTVSFALRAPQEQRALISAFARWLNSLVCPVQILIRSEWVDLSQMILELRETAPALPHPALEQAAFDHADFLHSLVETSDLTRRQVLLIFTDPEPSSDLRLAAERARRMVDTAGRTLAAAEVHLRVLDAVRSRRCFR